MKQNEKQIPKLKRKMIKLTRFLMVVLLALFFSGCCNLFRLGGHAGMKGDESGVGITAGGCLLEINNLSVLGMFSYDFLNWDYGHDNLYKAVAQVRKAHSEKPFWYGGEAGLVRDVSVYDESYWDDKPSANGFTVGGIAGYKLPVKSIDLNVYSGLSLVSFGDFKSDGNLVEPGHNKFQFRLGIELGLPFSK